jgi:hypothetical protein
VDGLVSVFRTFRIDVDRTYNKPYESLYIQAMPGLTDRATLDSLLQDQDIFNPLILYRPSDPYFGISTNVRYTHAFGIGADTLQSYVESMQLNHYKKKLILGEMKTAQAIDSNDNVLYEVVYSEIVDTGVNQSGESPPLQTKVAFPFTDPVDGSTEVEYVYPNSLINMRDKLLTKNWVAFDDSTQSGDWVTQKQTTFNYDQSTNPTASGNRTTFDLGSIRFVHPVDIYEYTDQYNKYLLYPKNNILQ